MNNREFKFRAFDPIEKHFNYFNLDHCMTTPSLTQTKYPVQQYTGLKDKNGKEIYEGDIVSVLDENNVFDVRFGNVKRNIVGFDTNTIYPIEISCFYFHRDGLPHFSITKNHLGKHDLEDTEVIGNIFENKELLE